MADRRYSDEKAREIFNTILQEIEDEGLAWEITSYEFLYHLYEDYESELLSQPISLSMTRNVDNDEWSLFVMNEQTKEYYTYYESKWKEQLDILIQNMVIYEQVFEQTPETYNSEILGEDPFAFTLDLNYNTELLG